MYADQSREHFRVNNTVKPAVLAEFIVSSRNEGATVSKEAVKNLSMFIHNITIKSPHDPLNGGTIDHVCAQWNGKCFVETMLSDPNDSLGPKPDRNTDRALSEHSVLYLA